MSLLHYGGSEFQDVFDSLHDTGTTYVKMKASLEVCFDPKSKSWYQTWNFQHTVQTEVECFQMYYLRLQEVANRCSFPDVNQAIITQLVLGTKSAKLQLYCFTKKDATVQDILTKGKLMEDIEIQTKEIESKQEKVEASKSLKVLRKEIAALKLQINQTGCI